MQIWLKDIKVWLYAAPNSAEFVHDLRYSQTWEYEWISKVFCGDKKLGYVGRLSKKSKNGDFSNSAFNKINNLQASKSQI